MPRSPSPSGTPSPSRSPSPPESAGSPAIPAGVTLDALLRAAGTLVELVAAPGGVDVTVESVVLADADDLESSVVPPAGGSDLWLHVGVPEGVALRWFERLAALDRQLRPTAVLSKEATSPAIQRAADHVGVALVAVHRQARSEILLSTIRGVLDHAFARRMASPRSGEVFDAGMDLFGLAQTVSSLTGGMVSIEDDRSLVLAYSASGDEADEVRQLSILGRAGPADYLGRLQQWGVFDRLRRSQEVIEVPADVALGTRRRLVVSIWPLVGPAIGGHHPRTDPTAGAGAPTLGTIWVQEGRRELSPDSESALRGAAAVAARLITRSLNAPTNEAMQIQRLLGARGGGVDVPSLAAALSLPTTGPAVVVGLSTVGDHPAASTLELAAALRLHASAFARESLVTAIGERIYVLLPRVLAPAGVTSWVCGVIERLAAHPGVAMRAAVAAPVANLADVGAARIEVDRVLDGTTADRRVTTLADSRTPVLLGEIADLIVTRPDLRDPRMAALLAYDARHGSAMRESVEEYLTSFADVRQAAAQLQIHPNTLRYRIRRAQAILEIDLADPAARLLMELQLLMLRRVGVDPATES